MKQLASYKNDFGNDQISPPEDIMGGNGDRRMFRNNLSQHALEVPSSLLHLQETRYSPYISDTFWFFFVYIKLSY